MALDSRAREILRIGDKKFAQKTSVDGLWEELALNFYPERADFLTQRHEGDEYADHLFSSTPILGRRELGNLMSSSLRPRATKWFSIHVDDEAMDDFSPNRSFLELMSQIQWRAVYDGDAHFVKATKSADHDFVTFGNAVLWFGLNIDGDGLLFRNYHLRLCTWGENAEGKIDEMHRNQKPTARQLKEQFPDKVSAEVNKAAIKDPEHEFLVRHVVVPSKTFRVNNRLGKAFPYTSLIVERDSETILEEVGLNYFPYVVPRWHTISGSVYGLSMATMVLLPDGRTMQAIMRTIREAGEKFVDPPMIAVADAIRGDLALYAGGVTTADMEYDERLGDVLRPVSQDRNGFPIGFEVAKAIKDDIASGFFLDKIQLPDVNVRDMTAFEVQRRIQEHIRAASPIFEPIEQEYNQPLMDGVFNLLKDNGAFPLDQMPDELQGQEVKFSFRSPLADLSDQNEAETYLDVLNRILLPLAQVDPAQLQQANMTRATRDAMRAAGWKADWFNPEGAVEQAQQQLKKQQEIQQGVQLLEQGGKAMEAAGKGGINVKEALSEEGTEGGGKT